MPAGIWGGWNPTAPQRTCEGPARSPQAAHLHAPLCHGHVESMVDTRCPDLPRPQDIGLGRLLCRHPSLTHLLAEGHIPPPAGLGATSACPGRVRQG